jgi:hypothetical protein
MAQGIGKHGELYARLIDPAHLLRCARAAARGKRRNPAVAAYWLDLEPRCFELARRLREGTWRPGGYTSFWIQEPKLRLISAAPFADRVVHHALVSILEPFFERRFVAHSYACRKGKGTHRALRRAVELSRRRRFVLKCDVAKFFPSLDRSMVKDSVRDVIADQGFLHVLNLVIDHGNAQETMVAWFPGDELYTPLQRPLGLPIGNLTSQFLANVVLDRIDHHVMDDLGFGDYVRYCDDFLVFGDDADELWWLRERVAEKLARLRLRLHPRKGGVHACTGVFPFLGFAIAKGRTSLLGGSVRRATRRLRVMERLVKEGRLAAESLQRSKQAWRAHASHADRQGIIRRVLDGSLNE